MARKQYAPISEEMKVPLGQVGIPCGRWSRMQRG
jgi:hypothetical protein